MRLLFVLAICPSFAVAQDNAEVALVKATLNELQVVSIAQNVDTAAISVLTRTII